MKTLSHRALVNYVVLGIILSTVILYSQAANAFIYFTLSGSSSKTTLYQEHNTRSVAGTVAFDLGLYFRLGFTHQQQYVDINGYNKDEDTDEIYYSKMNAHVMANSLDLTIILYNGEIFTPFIFAGGVFKTISSSEETDGKEAKVTPPTTVGPLPQGGAGLAIKLSENFSLKLSYTVCPGIKLHSDEKEEKVLDSTTSVGLTYRI